MKAFHNKLELKKKYLNRVKAHREADNLIRGTGWENGKGCAIGCTLENYDHEQYEKELGIPQVLAHLQDRIFEGLSNEEAMQWPEKFLSSVNVGADLSLVWPKFIIKVLSDPKHGTMRLCDEDGKKATQKVCDLYERVIKGETVTEEEWAVAARVAADVAADSAAAADVAADYAAARAARVAADYAAARAARVADVASDVAFADVAARAADVASDVAADAAARAADAGAAYYDAVVARENHYSIMSKWLIKELKSA